LQRSRGGLVFKAHRLGVSLDSRLEGNKEEERDRGLLSFQTITESLSQSAFSFVE
jgi:hypothetical protein